MNTYYYHTKENDNGRRATFAGIVEEGEIKIGASVCSNKDQFQKRIGRAISENRANATPVVSVPLVDSVSPGLVFRKAAEILTRNNKGNFVKLVSH